MGRRSMSPQHPGKLIGEILRGTGLTICELANLMKVSSLALVEIIDGQQNINPEIALRLAAVLGVSAYIWLDMQTDYSLALTAESLDLRDLTLWEDPDNSECIKTLH